MAMVCKYFLTSLNAALIWLVFCTLTDAADYVVVVSNATRGDNDWSKLIDELVGKYQAEVISCDQHVNETLPALQKIFPRFAPAKRASIPHNSLAAKSSKTRSAETFRFQHSGSAR